MGLGHMVPPDRYPPPMVNQQAVRIHPTGMHSCIWIKLLVVSMGPGILYKRCSLWWTMYHNLFMVITVPIHQGSISSWWSLYQYTRGQSLHGDHCTNTPGVNLFMVITVPIHQGSISSWWSLYQYTRGDVYIGVNLFMVITVPIHQGSISSWWSLYQYTRGQSSFTLVSWNHCTNTP